jgi:hypothetical protein
MNSTGSGAELFALGSGSFSEDDLVLGAKGLPGGVPVLIFYSSTPTQNFFGDGLLCVGGATLSGLSRVGRPRRAPSGGDMRWGPGLLSASWMQATAGRLHFQAIYRDPNSFCGTSINLSNALGFDLIP